MTQEHVERRLAAILVADVVGYSRLMGEDEAGTLRALQQHRYVLVDANIGHFHGRIVKLMGDGILVEFRSAVEAVECAIAIQHGMIERNREVPANKRIRFRIGINLGEVLVDGDDIYGDGVNVAARLQELAEPDGVCVSAGVHSHAEGEIEVTLTDLGAHNFKNIAKPVRAFHYAASTTSTASRAALRPFVDLPVDKPAEITGGCLCGNVRYEVSEPELGSMYCHCRMCQKFGGAPVMAGTTFQTASVRFTKGEPKYYKSSAIAERGFCADCGTALAYRGLIGVWTKWIMIFTVTLDNPENFAPTYHLGVESALPWLELQDGLPRIRCEDSPSLIEAYASVDEEVP